MKDISHRIINIGDKVIFIDDNVRKLAIGFVKRFTPTKVLIENEKDGEIVEYLRSPNETYLI